MVFAEFFHDVVAVDAGADVGGVDLVAVEVDFGVTGITDVVVVFFVGVASGVVFADGLVGGKAG